MASPGQVRIVGGLFRRTVVPVPGISGLRPTPDRVRETLFNWLDQRVPGSRCLDLFAGTGALGIEAASRGALSVLINDANREAQLSIRTLVDKLAVSNDQATREAALRIELRKQDAIALVNQLLDETRQFDVIFLDPPFESNWLASAQPLISQLLAPRGVLYLESNEPVTEYAGLRAFRSKKAGQVYYHLLNTTSDVETR